MEGQSPEPRVWQMLKSGDEERESVTHTTAPVYPSTRWNPTDFFNISSSILMAMPAGCWFDHRSANIIIKVVWVERINRKYITTITRHMFMAESGNQSPLHQVSWYNCWYCNRLLGAYKVIQSLGHKFLTWKIPDGSDVIRTERSYLYSFYGTKAPTKPGRNLVAYRFVNQSEAPVQ